MQQRLGEEMHAASQSREQGILTIWYKECAKLPHRNIEHASQGNKQELFPTPQDDLREAHMKLDPLQDTYPQKEDIRRFISTS
jgi:hypothetical protein